MSNFSKINIPSLFDNNDNENDNIKTKIDFTEKKHLLWKILCAVIGEKEAKESETLKLLEV